MAFAQVIGRHERMVFAVCRSLLPDREDARDAAQAVFMVLARKAGTLTKNESVAAWLHHVAYCVSVNLRESTAARQGRERKAAEMLELTRSESSGGEDINFMVLRELNGMPEKYRQALVLFHLEERSLEEVAGLFSCPVSTIGNRLARGRDLLKKRLVRRGMLVSTTALSGAFAGMTTAAPVPTGFAAATAQAALVFAAGKTTLAGGLISSQAGLLAKGALKTMIYAQVKWAASVVAVVGVLGATSVMLISTKTEGKSQEPVNAPRTVELTKSPLPTTTVASDAQCRFVASTFLGGHGTNESVVGVRIKKSGQIVVAANLAADFETRLKLPSPPSRTNMTGIVLLMSGDGQKILSSLRLPAEILDMAMDGNENIYAASADSQILRISPSVDQISRKVDVGSAIRRLDAGKDGHCAVLLSDRQIAVIDPDGKVISKFANGGTDVCLDSESRTVIYGGFRNAHAHDGVRNWPVQICYIRGADYQGNEKWRNYDWSTDRNSERFLNRSGNNMADTRTYRLSIGHDGQLYAAFETAGGNHLFNFNPTNIMEKATVVGGDQWHQFYNSKMEHKTVFAKFDPASGRLHQVQQFCGRNPNGSANSVFVRDGEITASEAGHVFVSGQAAAAIPVKPEPFSTEERRGGPFVLGMTADFKQRLVCTRVQGTGMQARSSTKTVDARRINNKTLVVFGGNGATTGMFTTNALQNSAVDADAFLVVLELDGAK